MGCIDCLQTIAHGAAGLAKAALGFDAAPAEVVRGRRDACRGCDQATRNPALADRPSRGLTSLSQCRECGCLIVAKTAIAGERCPLGKWESCEPTGAEGADRTPDEGRSIDIQRV
jgi:hypothetical protein